MIPRVATRADSFRVFYGFKRPDLEEAGFLSELGEVFMPGTPLMLRELGLAAYMPAVVPLVEGVTGLPDEVAIIAYASPERYTHARNESITGRMYTHTHRAVFDMGTSRSQFPEKVGSLQSPVTAFWCLGEPCDWQGDGDVVVWVGHASDDPDGFPTRFVTDLDAKFPALRDTGVRECVGQVGPTWASLWILIDRFGEGSPPPDVTELLRPGLGGSSELMLENATRLAWRDEPPTVPVTRASAWSFIFVRDLSHFLA